MTDALFYFGCWLLGAGMGAVLLAVIIDKAER